MIIFAIPVMRENHLKYIIVLFFIALFSFKGLVSVCPMLTIQMGKITGIEKLINTETEPAEKNGEEKSEKEIKEFFIGINTHHTPDIPFALTTKDISSNNIARNQDVFLPVITPPPELF
ncbi:hypothetical protein [Ferruginibacter sp.]